MQNRKKVKLSTFALGILGAATAGQAGIATNFNGSSAGWGDNNSANDWSQSVNWSNGIPTNTGDTGTVGSGTTANATSDLGTASQQPTVIINTGGTVYMETSIADMNIILNGGTWDDNWRSGKVNSASINITANSTIQSGIPAGSGDGDGTETNGAISGAAGNTLTVNDVIRWDPSTYSNLHVDYNITGSLELFTSGAQLGTGSVFLANSNSSLVAEYPWQNNTLNLTNNVSGFGTIQAGSGSKATSMSNNIISPGDANDAGSITVHGSLQMAASTTLDIRLFSASSYDQLIIDSSATSIDLGSAGLDLSLDYAPQLGDSFTIVNNQSDPDLTGIFAGYADGSTFTLNGYAKFDITYEGGPDDNSAVLTVIGVPEPTLLAPIAMAAGGLLVRRKRRRQA